MKANDSLLRPSQPRLRRTIILGVSVLTAFLFIGIAMTFWWEQGQFWWRYGELRTPAPSLYRLLVKATVWPIFIGVYFLGVITLPVMFVLTIMVGLGSQLRRIWLSALAFVLIGLYWLWLVTLMERVFW